MYSNTETPIQRKVRKYLLIITVLLLCLVSYGHLFFSDVAEDPASYMEQAVDHYMDLHVLQYLQQFVHSTGVSYEDPGRLHTFIDDVDDRMN